MFNFVSENAAKIGGLQPIDLNGYSFNSVCNRPLEVLGDANVGQPEEDTITHVCVTRHGNVRNISVCGLVTKTEALHLIENLPYERRDMSVKIMEPIFSHA